MYTVVKYCARMDQHYFITKHSVTGYPAPKFNCHKPVEKYFRAVMPQRKIWSQNDKRQCQKRMFLN